MIFGKEKIKKDFFPIRLNPEIKIHLREKDKELEKYLRTKDFAIEKDNFKHRRLQDSYIAHITFTQNAGKKYADLAFAKPEELREKIDQFNQELNDKRDFNTAWKYGIDRGNIELATLCLVKFDPNQGYLQN